MSLIRNYKTDKSVPPPKQLLNFIRTSNKYTSIWQYLKRYQNVEFVKLRLKQEYPSLSTRLITTKSRHIADAVRQSEAYFNTAQSTELAIKPLIVYYGMMNLVKALIMFGDNKYTLNVTTLEKSGIAQHGLSIQGKNPNDYSVRNNQNDLLNEFCYVQKRNSIFKLLHRCWSSVDLNTNMRFSINKLALSHPYSWKLVNNVTHEVPNFFLADGGFRKATKIEQAITLSSVTQFSIYKKPQSVDAWDYLEQLLPKLKTLYDRNPNSAFSYVSKNTPSTIDEIYSINKSIAGESYLIGDFDVDNKKLMFTPIEVEYMSMFILGSLTRYAPQKWLKNVRYEGGTEMSLLEGLVNSTIISFPKMILEELDGENYTVAGDVFYWD
ncbi:MAG: YaaC family protein [Candidatus Paceibacterota bacterium]|jgi:hypothetical protein